MLDRLLALHADGEVEVLTAPVVVAPLLSPDGARLAVAVGDAEGPSQLRILGPGDLDRDEGWIGFGAPSGP